jgi:hypothetical protein
MNKLTTTLLTALRLAPLVALDAGRIYGTYLARSSKLWETAVR